MNDRQAHIWVGIDAGKAHHWVTAIDDQGAMLWSRKVSNDESAILDPLAEVLTLGENFTWAVDIVGTTSALLLALLASHGQSALYVPGRIVKRMAGAYRGEAKTDARDAYVIAETARHRHDLTPIRLPVEIIADLKLLIAHRGDLVADRVRMLNRLRDVLTGIFPRLDRAFDYAKHKGALTLLTGYQTPTALRRMGQVRLTKWLARRGVQGAPAVAEAALEAASGQQTQIGNETIAAQIIALDKRLRTLENQITTMFHAHPQAEIIESMPGMGPILGAEFLAAAGPLDNYADDGHLAAAAGLIPVPRDSGRRTGNMHRPKRYNRHLRRSLYLSAQTSVIREGPNRDLYLKKRSEGYKHTQALLALSRRRVSVLWALLRDNRTFTPAPPIRSAQMS
ncbi:IS110 family transposase [Rathayibacter sp. AY1E8]|uniref:IS110 family transposase n=1 Tax=Rathayibacter sp. AY1E8 TaxID=2080555 RepID=UPI000CE92215|nr:IS110 family transposase [Rathayibacter sp. AY1E8]PPG18827.1 IS110 family transposase [Rathayibacter sp. AY1E8]